MQITIAWNHAKIYSFYIKSTKASGFPILWMLVISLEYASI